MRFYRLAAIAVAVLLWFSVCVTDVGTARKGLSRSAPQMTNTKLTLDVNELSDGLVEVTVGLDSINGICGLLAKLIYDPTVFVLISHDGEHVPDGFDFSHAAQADEVSFLLDSDKNSPPKCVIAVFYFKRIADGQERSEFSLKIGDGKGCFYLDGDRLCPVEIDASECSAAIGGNAGGGAEKPPTAPLILGVNAERSDTGISLTVLGQTESEAVFAAGFRIFAVNTDGAQAVRITASRLTTGKIYGISLMIPDADRVCVIVTPIAYSADGCTEGEKKSYLFEEDEPIR